MEVLRFFRSRRQVYRDMGLSFFLLSMIGFGMAKLSLQGAAGIHSAQNAVISVILVSFFSFLQKA